MTLGIPKGFGAYPDLDKRIEEAYENRDIKGYGPLNSIIAESVDKGILYNVLDFLEFLRMSDKKKWIEEQNNQDKENIFERRSKDLWDDVIRVLYNENLGIEVEEDGEILEMNPHRLVIAWKSNCPVLSEGGLPAKNICQGAGHRPYELILKELDSFLWFNRVYGRLRPEGDSCIEIIGYGDLLVSYNLPKPFNRFQPRGKWHVQGKTIDETLPQNVVAIPPPVTSLYDIERVVDDWKILEETHDFFRENQLKRLAGLRASYSFNQCWNEYPLIGRKIKIPVCAFEISRRQSNLSYHLIWAENRDEWVAIPYRSPTCGKPADIDLPRGTVVHYIPDVIDEIFGDREEGYQAVGYIGVEILKAFSIFPGDKTAVNMSSEDACVTHPLKLEYLGEHKISGK